MGFTLGTKFNEGTDWEFTVSNETIESVVSGGGVTESDIADYCFTALIDARCKAMVAESVRNTNDGLYPWALDYCAGYMSNSGSNPCKVSMNVDKLSSEAVTCYERNLLTYYGNINGVTGHYLVMDMVNIKKWCINFDTTPIYSSGNVSTTASFPGYSGAVYVYSESNKSQIVPYDPESEAEDPITGDLRLVNVLTMNDSLWIGYLNPSANSKELLANQYMVQQAWDTAYAAANTFNPGYPQYILQGLPTNFQGWSNFPDAEFPESTGQTQGFSSYLECDDTVHSVIRIVGQYGNNQSSFQTVNIEQGNLVKTLKDVHMIEAWCGLLFIDNGVLYKPLIENKVIVGFTNDMDRPSEWDDITNVTGNNITPTPPSPTPSGDDDNYDDMGIGVGTNVGGLTNYAIMSIRDLATLLADFNEHLETGMSIQNNFVCLYKLGPLSSFLCNTSVRAIVMSANAENNFVSVDDYSVVSGQKGEHYFGSYDVPRFTNTFYDFSPYSTYELFIPCCGWVPLPDTVAGRKINVYLIFDLASCTCKGVVRISGTTVAEISGVLGASVPFYMIEHGMERLAQVTAITQTLSSLAVGGVGAASGNAGVAAYGLSQLTQSLNDLNVSGNTNFTAIKGGNSDMSAMGNGEYCTIKITHPVVDSVVDNSMFGHSVGYLCNSIGKLSGYSGFTVCGNPHVTFSASAEEREEIERLLSMGVIL